MARYRNGLPQLQDELFLTDGGIETDLIFNKGVELPDFAAFALLEGQNGKDVLADYFREHVAVAIRAGVGFVLESPTWRANPDWGQRLGYDEKRLSDLNGKAIELMTMVRDEADATRPIVVSGCVGPRGDGYQPDTLMSIDEARAYHRAQIGTFAESEADLVSAITMGYTEEAAGIALAARDAGLPVVVSFTTETDGRLPTGPSLLEAVATVERETNGYPAYYMVNCAHPDHFGPALDHGSPWTDRIRGVRANASRASHAELDDAPTLDAGDPAELGALYADLRRKFPQLTVLGGCCGTDVRHVREIAAACLLWS